jgi:hypothetical protein
MYAEHGTPFYQVDICDGLTIKPPPGGLHYDFSLHTPVEIEPPLVLVELSPAVYLL